MGLENDSLYSVVHIPQGVHCIVYDVQCKWLYCEQISVDVSIKLKICKDVQIKRLRVYVVHIIVMQHILVIIIYICITTILISLLMWFNNIFCYINYIIYVMGCNLIYDLKL